MNSSVHMECILSPNGLYGAHSHVWVDGAVFPRFDHLVTLGDAS